MAEIAQAGMTQAELEAAGIVWPPTQDELPYDDGMPMESQRHVMQLQLLEVEARWLRWATLSGVLLPTPQGGRR